MWKKIKNYLIIIGAGFLVIVLTVYYVLMRGSKVDRRGSERADERDSAIQGGIAECQEGAERVSERLDKAGESADRCEEHLRRAEEILRNAIKRSREGEPEA